MKAQNYLKIKNFRRLLVALTGFHWQKAIVYRLTISSYKFGEVAETILLSLIWLAIYSTQSAIGSFTAAEMITYLTVGSVFNILTRSYVVERVASDIKKGKLSAFLTRPLSYIKFTFIGRLGTLTFHLVLGMIINTIPVWLFRGYLVWPDKLSTVFVLVLMLIFAFISEWFISFLVGSISFWTTEVSGLQVTIERLRLFFAGGYFPIALLPAIFVKISFALPFAYTFFIPTQLYLGKIPLSQGLWGLLVQAIWIVILYLIATVVWKKGLRKYEGVGT